MSQESRSKKALYNTLSYSVGIVVEIIISLILPRLILTKFGSANNGLVASIEQFLSYTQLLYLGLVGATRAALYGPLSRDDKPSINAIMSATQKFMRRVSLTTAAAVLAFSFFYPLLVMDDFSWWYTASLALILSISTLSQYYFAMQCRIILAADQKNYIITIVDITALAVSSIASVVLIQLTDSIHLVKLGAACLRSLGPLVLYMYVRHHYEIDYSVDPDDTSIGQRWDAAAHSVAYFVSRNTDIVVLTLMTSVMEVSVYTVYYLVINGLAKVGTALASGMEGAFGNILARGESQSLQRNFSAFETVMLAVSSVLYVCCAMLIVPFVMVYTSGVSDVSYNRPLFGFLASLAGMLSTVRIPYQTLVQAAGKYRETRNGAITESVINIVISLVMVLNYGLVGVSIGTAVALAYRTIQFARYGYKSILNEDNSRLLKRFLVLIAESLVAIACIWLLPLPTIETYLQWMLYASEVLLITAASVTAFTLLFWKEDVGVILRFVKRAVR